MASGRRCVHSLHDAAIVLAYALENVSIPACRFSHESTHPTCMVVDLSTSVATYLSARKRYVKNQVELYTAQVAVVKTRPGIKHQSVFFAELSQAR